MAAFHGWAELSILGHRQALVRLRRILESALRLFDRQSAWTPQKDKSGENLINRPPPLCPIALQNGVSQKPTLWVGGPPVKLLEGVQLEEAAVAGAH